MEGLVTCKGSVFHKYVSVFHKYCLYFIAETVFDTNYVIMTSL